MSNRKGFTIIELIVVIAIIAVLAVIVLVNVQSYTTRGKNAAIKANLSSALTESVKHFESNGNYDFWCLSIALKFINAATNAGATVTCQCNTMQNCWIAVGPNTAWCMSATLLGGAGTFCVDYTGAKKMNSTCSWGVCQ